MQKPIHSFKDILTFVSENVLVPLDVQHTCYFPSDEALRGLLSCYMRSEAGQGHQDIGDMQSAQLNQFVLVLLLMREYSRQAGHADIGSVEGLRKITQMLQKNEDITKEQPRPGTAYKVHQHNLMLLLSALIKQHRAHLEPGLHSHFLQLSADEQSLVLP